MDPTTTRQAGGRSGARDRARPRIIGHRGAAALEPENTLRSFRRALADGASAVECDVHVSADGHVVVMHDETIERTADPRSPRRTGALAELSRAQLDEVRLGEDERVPVLEDLLDLLAVHGSANATPPQVLVEVKAVAAAREVGRILSDRLGARPAGPLEEAPALVISFHPEALAAVRETAPDIPRGLIVERTDERTPQLLEQLDAAVLAVGVEHVTPADGELAHRAGRALNVWTVNDAEALARAMAAGADTVTTDDPGRWIARLAEIARG